MEGLEHRYGFTVSGTPDCRKVTALGKRDILRIGLNQKGKGAGSHKRATPSVNAVSLAEAEEAWLYELRF